MINLQIVKLTIDGTGYTLAGNSFAITSVQGIVANQSTTINAAVGFNTSSYVNFYPADGTTLALGGATSFTVSSPYEINIGSSSYGGMVDFTGTMSGTGGEQFIAVNGAKVILLVVARMLSSAVSALKAAAAYSNAVPRAVFW